LYKRDVTEPLGPPRGVLRATDAAGAFAHERRAPVADLAGFIEHFWRVAWEVPGAPVVREVLSHPSVHITIERGRSAVTGVPRGRFTRRLEGNGLVFGIKFVPGGFRPLVAFPIAQLTDRAIPLDQILGSRGPALEAAVLSQATMAGQIMIATAHLRELVPERDATVEQVAALVKQVLDDREIRKVDDLAQRSGLGSRALQRLFSDYVGVSPKWVIRRYRLHEAMERMDTGTAIDWSALALELGYFDQAHFIRDFKSLVGRTPGDYQRT
jgi:AraC-like DNA-binding protein